MVWQLWRGAAGMGAAAHMDARLRRRLPRILAATATMTLCLVGAHMALAPALDSAQWRIPALAALVLAGLASYAAAALALGAVSLPDLRTALRRGR